MRRLLVRIGIPSAIIFTGFVLSSPSSFGKAEYTKKEKKACTVCHAAAGKKELNDVGKCYAEHNHSLDACSVK